jgi:hypothetical protein
MKPPGRISVGVPVCVGLLFAATALWYVSFMVVSHVPTSEVPATFWFLLYSIGPLISFILGLMLREAYLRRPKHAAMFLWIVLVIGWSPLLCFLLIEGWPMIRWRLLH